MVIATYYRCEECGGRFLPIGSEKTKEPEFCPYCCPYCSPGGQLKKIEVTLQDNPWQGTK